MRRFIRGGASRAASSPCKYIPSNAQLFVAPKRTRRQVIIVGGGHNGLVAAAYLAKAGMDVLVLERRQMVGGAAVTEELHPGFRYSRASYVAGLLRPCIVEELQLERFGFKYLPRETSGFTLCDLDGPHAGKYLRFCSDAAETEASIAQFSPRGGARTSSKLSPQQPPSCRESESTR